MPKKFLPKLTSVFLLLYVAATLPLLTNRLTSFAYIVQGIVQSGQKAEDEATETLRIAIQPNFWDASLYYILGSKLSDRGKIEEAIAAYRQAIRLDPKYDLFYEKLGKALIQQGKHDEAIATYRQAIKVNPQWAWAYNELGKRLYFNKWKFDEAIAAYRQAIQIDPNNADAYNNLANTLSLQGKLKEAIAAYRQAIQIDPKYEVAYSGLGFALQEEGRLDEAISAYHQAIQIYPNYAKAYNNLGNALFEQGKQDEAIAAYRQAIKIDPKYDIAYRSLGLALEKQGKLDEAIAVYHQALQIDPHSAIVYNLGKTLQQQGKFDRALEVYKRASTLPHNPRKCKLLIEETERLLTMQKNPQLLAIPERLPSLKDEPLVLLKRSVVRVITKNETQSGSGTGWVVKRQGKKAWVVTNRHVAMAGINVVMADTNMPVGDLKIEVEFYSQPHSGEVRKRKPAKIAKITAASDKLDLALLEVTDIPKDIQPLARSSASVALNAPIRIIGYPYTKDDSTVEIGEIINKSDRELRMSAISAPGNSGSPVLDQQNRVVGLVWGSNSQTQNQQPDGSGSALAFPIQSVTKHLKDWGID